MLAGNTGMEVGGVLWCVLWVHGLLLSMSELPACACAVRLRSLVEDELSAALPAQWHAIGEGKPRRPLHFVEPVASRHQGCCPALGEQLET
jgi:hypothetical protein